VIVVADTSPLNYLIEIECDHVLPALYNRLLLPSAVMQELRHLRAPSSVKAWLNSVPDWIELCDPPAMPDPTLGFLHEGEREAIQIAEQRHADLILIDERRGSLEAGRRGLIATGTLGVLLSAGKAGLIDPLTAYGRLASETTFRTSASLERAFIALIAK
jgi:predicted nucleic acid-binding protein